MFAIKDPTLDKRRNFFCTTHDAQKQFGPRSKARAFNTAEAARAFALKYVFKDESKFEIVQF